MLSAVTSMPGLPPFPLSEAGTAPLDNITAPVQLPKTQPDSTPLYSMPTTRPYSAARHSSPRLRKPLFVGGAVAAIVVIGLIAWSFRGGPGPRDNPEPGTTNSKVSDNTRATTDVTPPSDTPTPAARLKSAREQAAADCRNTST